ncbi:hypothetical protein ACFQI7_28105 [Paenibacillus allorhizosphaerae]|uniref:Uncharacterized protein n=1 Tax=Paenibacillus allorhizosphaerae TaxID=2849866 RepID=A0ABM8VNI7_9BACL|nr:hypothetical protein [Paenibacillus allorhizosphaerae]CAG7651539.1 hypothetical protein PAECIP111802_04989 [Paenibacillus allorhizosphaerae]
MSQDVKLILSWIFIGMNLLAFGPTFGLGLLFVPIMPLFLAGMSTDSGDKSLVLPIIVIGYAIILLWGTGLFFSIRFLYLHRKTRKTRDLK